MGTAAAAPDERAETALLNRANLPQFFAIEPKIGKFPVTNQR
jgi:hypothetical protein